MRKIYTGCALVGVLAAALCTKVDYSNPIDADGSNYVSGICSSPECIDSATAITSNNIAAYYDSTSAWYQHHKGRILQHSTPVITFTGGTPPGTDSVIIALNDPNHVLGNLGCSASDPIYGDLSKFVIITGVPYASRCSTYATIYSVTNRAGDSTQRTRYIIVDCSAPQLTLLGANPDSIQIGVAYHDPGATAIDNIDGNVTSKIHATPASISTSAAAIDTVTYSVSDRAGNIDSAQRIVVVYKPLVKDTIAPVITLNGDNPMNIAKNAVYVEPGATALDNIDGNISNKIIISGTVNTAVSNTYTITYTRFRQCWQSGIKNTDGYCGGRRQSRRQSAGNLAQRQKSGSVKVGSGPTLTRRCKATDTKDGAITVQQR